MRVLAVDHDAVLSADRSFYRALCGMSGMDVTLIVPRRWEAMGKSVRAESEASSLRVVDRNAIFVGRPHRTLYASLRRTVRTVNPNIICANTEPEAFFAYQIVRLRNSVVPSAKVLLDSWRNLDYSATRFPYRLSWLHRLLERSTLPGVDHIVAHNATAKEIFSRRGYTNVTVIPPGVDTELFKQASGDTLRESLGLKAFTIGYIGRLITDKGVDLLLRAAGTLTFPFQLLIVGGGPELPELRATARSLGIGDRLVWAGTVRHDEVPAYLNAMDILVLPSRTGKTWKEQFGRVLIEAMSCCVPVIGSSSGEIPRVIGDAGFLFQEGSVSELADALHRAHGDSKMTRELARRGVARVQDHFDVKRVAEQYRDLLLSLKTPE